MAKVLLLDGPTAGALSNLVQIAHIIIDKCVPDRPDTQTLKKMWYAPVSLEIDDGTESSAEREITAIFRSGTSAATVEVYYVYPPKSSDRPIWIGMYWQDTPTSPKMKVTVDRVAVARIVKKQLLTVEPQLAQ